MRVNDIDKIIEVAASPARARINEYTESIIGAAIEVTVALGQDS